MEALRATNLKAYYGKAQVLHGIDLVAQPGTVTAILGRNGAGKTTLLQSVMGLGPRIEGEVTILGEPARGLTTDAIARLGVAYMPQDVRGFPKLSVRENIQVAASTVRSPRPLSEILEVLPEIEPKLDSPAGTLSGGQQQLVGIARSLSMRCQLLLMDEPTEGLMPRLVSQIGVVLRQLASEGVAIVIVEQNIGLMLDIGDVVHIVEKGVIKWRGTPQDVVSAHVLDHYMGVSPAETSQEA
ncbi:ABC transporter ATP-binding protein [Microbaculum marinisediminis]|uniref:ABC transporter ATP-binding protein n=1 Tax=Microbaculum marinisediminis TaxID=2931392 RepID=A0AAW5R6E0_9HYPH|nr:ABC transporter ATP-binding protein [Microbaculum sp. A6E488]MCT8974251.1 ABC transporter ATP-binding protein [Microbaculum sp. A6E488]